MPVSQCQCLRFSDFHSRRFFPSDTLNTGKPISALQGSIRRYFPTSTSNLWRQTVERDMALDMDGGVESASASWCRDSRAGGRIDFRGLFKVQYVQLLLHKQPKCRPPCTVRGKSKVVKSQSK